MSGATFTLGHIGLAAFAVVRLNGCVAHAFAFLSFLGSGCLFGHGIHAHTSGAVPLTFGAAAGGHGHRLRTDHAGSRGNSGNGQSGEGDDKCRANAQ